MTAHRMSAAVVAALPLLITAVAAAPARAHGAPTDPVARVVACGPDGGADARSAACAAAVAANGGRAFPDWDNLRVADVRGRDRQVIPDGRLCSGGLPAFRGLDLPRRDWPATTLAAGSALTVTYRATIPHRGTFHVYLTKPGYAPDKPLTWADLDPEPLVTAEDPPLVNGAHRLEGTLPRDRTGRHVLYTVWRNTDTPDTYYSCSDVLLTGGPGAAAARGDGGRTTREAGSRDRGGPAPGTPAAPLADSTSRPAPAAGGGASTVPVSADSSSGGAVKLLTGLVAVLAVVAALSAAVLRRRAR
ncbi:lytic polysaccharide monooxygenase [Streptomyces capparidis]